VFGGGEEHKQSIEKWLKSMEMDNIRELTLE